MPDQKSKINKLFAILAILLISISTNVSASLISQFTQPDTIIQDPYNPQNLNRYSYVLNNPYKYNDPNGHSPTIISGLIGAGVGLLIGGSFSIAEQYFTTGEVNWKQVGISASIGAVSGGVAGLTLGLGNVAIGMAGLTGTSATVAGGAVAATSSMIGGQAARASYNVAEDREITEGLGNPKDIALDAGIGLATFGVGKKVILPKDNVNIQKLSSLPKEAEGVIQKVYRGDTNNLRAHIFENRERILPIKTNPKYYTSYDVINKKDPQRIVRGLDGKIYYTKDHYKSLKRVEFKSKNRGR